MNCEEIKISLHDYIDEIIASEYKKEIETHLRKCEACFTEYNKLNKFFDALKEIPFTIEIPQDIVETLSSELLNKIVQEKEKKENIQQVNVRKIKREQLKQESNLKHSRGAARKSHITRTIATGRITEYVPGNIGLNFKKTVLTLIPLFIIALAYFVYDFTLINSPWKIRSTGGTYLINGSITETGLWNEGESLFTEDNSTVMVSVPNTGKLEIIPNSIVSLEKAKDGYNKIILNKGEIKISNTSLLPDLSIQLNDCIVYDRGGVIYLSNKNKIARIFVEYGLAEYERKGNKYLICEGYVTEIRSGHRAGTPYRIDAPDSLKNEIEIFDYQNGGSNSLDNIIKFAKTKDMLTLLALIPHASTVKRGMLFQTIANHFPPPSNVTYDGIIKLNKEMLVGWWYEIEWQL